MYFHVGNFQKAESICLCKAVCSDIGRTNSILERLKHSDPHPRTHTLEKKYSKPCLQEFPYLVICSRSRTFSSKPRS